MATDRHGEFAVNIQRPDRGPFKWCGDGDNFIVSDDFTYDAGLHLSGDFPDRETKRAYMQRVMDILNSAEPPKEDK